MDINAHNMSILRTTIDTRFRNAYANAAKDSYNAFVMDIPMTTENVTMPFLQQLTGMREWIGDRQINNLETGKMTITPKKYENTYGIPRDAIEDDTYGMYMPLVDNMAVQAANLKPDLIEDLLRNAASQKWADGASFFGTTRKYGKNNTISNYTTSALSKATLKTAYDAMKAYKGHGDNPLRVQPTLLVHGPALRWTAKQILDNPQEESNGAALPNETYNLVQHLEVDGIGNKWFLFATGNGAYKPVAYFDRVKPDRIVRKDREEDDNVFLNDQYLYGCRGRATAAFLLPHLAYFGNVAD